MTGVLCTQPESVGLDHHYVSGNQQMARSRKKAFRPIVCPAFDSAAPTQTSDTSTRSQGGVVFWFRAAAVQRARERAIALQSANTYETSRCHLL